ncbi:response regulator transcription factor [Cnuibacter physcomitrellae]|uniref:response regulator transcription factor n=1 Tax=Cnuibacter physcomitrellae TaxID=1619308 RepID=UPI002175ADC7|nr:response regulator transcription factor [Cnuibacter physcomitrellae]MCS5497100.1 response regulator transcription factor [Cnuibacter physcomitrellae]
MMQATDAGPSILVVEDDPQMASLLRRGLMAEGYSVTLAADGLQGLVIAGRTPPAMAVLDVMLPGMSGFELCRRLRELIPGLMVIMLTARDEVGDRVRGLDVGADDYLVKPFAFSELAARLRALRRRNAQQTPSVLTVGDIVLDTIQHRVTIGGVIVHLSPKEYQLLALLAAQPGETIARTVIMTEIWGTTTHADVNIVDQYVSYLRRKLDAVPSATKVITERGVGFRLTVAP